ncbi:MAG: peptide deformylase, partial [Acidobacteriota bacterium]|nr:peptide deformylase [Acidobacteriota bacterium]
GTGDELSFDAEGLEARVIQHELDHLNGVLILDRISREARRQAMRELREAREDDER